mgnify:FL=1
MLGLSKARKEAARREGAAVKTDPGKWEKAKSDAKARMGGKHSARAMQLATKLYKERGGGYKGKKKETSLSRWSKQDWQYSGKGKGVYLPKKKIESLRKTAAGREKLAAASRKKAKATREGKQYARHGLAAGTSKKGS